MAGDPDLIRKTSSSVCLHIYDRVGAWTDTLKNPPKCLWRWEPGRRSNFFFVPPAHLYAVTYITEISLHVTLSKQSNSNWHKGKQNKRHMQRYCSYMWRHIDVQADWRSWAYGRAPNARDIFVRFFNVPVRTPTRSHPFYGKSEKPTHLVAFYNTVGKRRTYSHLDPRSPHREKKKQTKKGKENGRDLTQSYDKNFYTKKIQKATWQHKTPPKTSKLHNNWGPT